MHYFKKNSRDSIEDNDTTDVIFIGNDRRLINCLLANYRLSLNNEVKVSDFHERVTCDRAACAPAQLWLTCTSQPATRRHPVALLLVAPAVAHSAVVCCGRSSTLGCAAHPRSAAAQRGAEAGAAGACVSAAPAGVPRGRRAKKNAAKVASKGTPLPDGALWA